MKNAVLLTGATGFIGSHIAELFCSKGIKLTCLTRKTSDTSLLQTLPAECRIGDICHIASIKRALKDCNAVIHTAAYAKDWGSYRIFRHINVDGTLNVMKAAKECGIQNIILTGSISEYGEEDSALVKNECSPFNSHYNYFMGHIFPSGMNYYRDSKAEAIIKASEYAELHNMDLTVIEPVWVFGEREFNTGFYEYLKTAKKRLSFMPGSRNNRFHVIYAKDLAKAYLKAYEKHLSGIHRFIIGNPESGNMNNIFTAFCREAGVKKPVLLPKWAIYPIGFMLELMYSLLKFPAPPLLTRGRVNMFYDSIQYSTEKAADILGFIPEYSLEQGIRNTISWYKEHNLL